MIQAPHLRLRHLVRLSDIGGLREFAKGSLPDYSSGYATDDAGRLLAIACRLPEDPAAHQLAVAALSFLRRAHHDAKYFRLRMRADGLWMDGHHDGDAHGRALYGLGTAMAYAPWHAVRTGARLLFLQTVMFRSSHPRAMSYAMLGASNAMLTEDATPAEQLIRDGASILLEQRAELDEWEWWEPRLTYANALLPHALLSAGIVLHDNILCREALRALQWLVDEELSGDHFSFTPVGGRGMNDVQPAFDQQPIEAWEMAEACLQAYMYTGEEWWASVARCAAEWFLGRNDHGIVVFDKQTLGGYDGLTRNGVNVNEGAESTLAFIGSMLVLQHLESITETMGRLQALGTAR